MVTKVTKALKHITGVASVKSFTIKKDQETRV